MSYTPTTLKDLLSSSVSDFFVSHVSNHLSEWLKTAKNVDCSQQEICGAFGLQFTQRTSMAGLPQAASMATQMPNLPGYMQGTGASPRKSGTGTTGGGRKKATADPNGPKCCYQFQRGDKKGQVCGAPVANNGEVGSSEYCRGCLKKKTVQGSVKGGGPTTGGKKTVAPPSAPGGMVSVPDQEQGGGENTIKAVPIEGHPDMFKDTENNFILRQCADQSIVALCVEVNGVQRPLTSDEKKKAQLLGLSVMDSPQAVSQVVPLTIPTIPHVGHSVHSIPTIPTLGMDHA